MLLESLFYPLIYGELLTPRKYCAPASRRVSSALQPEVALQLSQLLHWLPQLFSQGCLDLQHRTITGFMGIACMVGSQDKILK